MGEDQQRTPKDASGGGFREAWRRRAGWQRTAAIASMVLTLASGILVLTTGTGAATASGEATASRAIDDDPSSGLGPGDIDRNALAPGISSGFWEGPLPPPLPGGGAGEDENAEDAEGSGSGDPLEAGDGTGAGADQEFVWSPALFKTGFSFFMGFSLAFAIRSFVRISLVAIGMMGLMLFGLEYMGLVTVEWGVMAERWDGMLGWLKPQLTSFQGFITGQLPSAAAATGGLVTGWRRG